MEVCFYFFQYILTHFNYFAKYSKFHNRCLLVSSPAVAASFSPANCLSEVPLPPNLVTSFPLDWKMKTQQALLSTVMMCPFLSTATPLGPMSRPAPILFCDAERQKSSLVLFQAEGKWWGRKTPKDYFLIDFTYEQPLNEAFSAVQPAQRSYLKLPIRREDADPPIVIVGHHNVTVHVNSDTRWSLQLPWRPTSDPKAHLELAIIGENLQLGPSKQTVLECTAEYTRLNIHFCAITVKHVATLPHLYALVVAVSHHHSAITRGWDPLEICELAFLSTPRTWQKKKGKYSRNVSFTIFTLVSSLIHCALMPIVYQTMTYVLLDSFPVSQAWESLFKAAKEFKSKLQKLAWIK